MNRFKDLKELAIKSQMNKDFLEVVDWINNNIKGVQYKAEITNDGIYISSSTEGVHVSSDRSYVDDYYSFDDYYFISHEVLLELTKSKCYGRVYIEVEDDNILCFKIRDLGNQILQDL